MTGRQHNQYFDRSPYPAELVKRRRRIGMSQSALARAVPCSLNTLNGWERHRNRPHDDLTAAARAAIETAELELLAELLAQHPTATTAAGTRQEGT